MRKVFDALKESTAYYHLAEDEEDDAAVLAYQDSRRLRNGFDRFLLVRISYVFQDIPKAPSGWQQLANSCYCNREREGWVLCVSKPAASADSLWQHPAGQSQEAGRSEFVAAHDRFRLLYKQPLNFEPCVPEGVELAKGKRPAEREIQSPPEKRSRLEGKVDTNSKPSEMTLLVTPETLATVLSTFFDQTVERHVDTAKEDVIAAQTAAIIAKDQTIRAKDELLKATKRHARQYEAAMLRQNLLGERTARTSGAEG
ncbi:uncharacterized protein EV422DRAFT_606195 [Fimicolochytrium jonesii]|uniref:uncharacterized protein n=1 Tax=Fimicolochytrium jonesii TaxID=1396493 RepID=UPI0022FE8FDC|nr:uncharacterized protein EV422DRAFT_606195 [Fimicolochytrium jonesii]KAI8825294.1 hypothetical protein EV422DRAFT_606195 [Fimicolochytrium jonesii]